MTDLTAINKSLIEIGQLLASNAKLRALLLDDDDQPSMTKEFVQNANFNSLTRDKVLSIGVPGSYGIERDHMTRNTSIVIILDRVSFHDEMTHATTFIYTSCDVDHILLKNNRNRLFEINQEIVKTLQGAKITSSGAIQVDELDSIRYNEFVVGYRISLDYINQDSERTML